MSWLKELFRLRRQSDKVKWALLLFLLAGALAVDLALRISEYAGLAAEPVEYVLASGKSGATLEVSVQALKEADGVLGVSRQREYSLTVGENTLTVTELTEQYLAACYGISSPGNGFWLDEATFRQMFGSSESPAHAACRLEDKPRTGSFYRRPGIPDGGARAVSRGDSRSLGPAGAVRVMFQSTDLSGTRESTLEQMGFSVQNQEVLLEQGFRSELLATRLRYGSCALALALLAGRLLYSAGKREV